MAITAERLEVEVSADTSRAKRELDGFTRSTSRAGDTVTKAGAKATAGGRRFSAMGAMVKAAAGAMVVAMGTKVVMAASDLNEVLSKTGVVFGPAAKNVTKAAQDMADQFGISKAVFLDAASGLGLVAKASGLTKKAAASLSIDMGKLAADAASFYNVPIEEALLAMKSGLVGEAEPMRRFGVLLSEAAVKTEAVRLGIAATTDELTEGQKVQARSSLIMRGMSDASGDLARTQESVANRVRELQGRIVNMAADLGTKALPVVEKLMALIIDKGIPKVQEWGRVFQSDVLPPVKAVGETVLSLIQAIGKLPDPLKSAALQAGLAALALWKIVPAVQAVHTKAIAATGSIAAMGAKMALMRGAAGAVGIAAIALGGMTDKTTETGKAVGTLTNLVGGAALGFAMGGPLGAGVGFVGGAMLSLATNTDKSSEAFWANRKAAQSFKATLDSTTGAITRLTRAQAYKALQDLHVADEAATLNVATRDLVGATLGQEGATKRVNAAIARGLRLGGDSVNAASALQIALFGVEGQMDATGRVGHGLADSFTAQQRAARKAIEANKTWKEALKGIPKVVRTKLENQNYQATMGQVRGLRREYDLTPKQVATIVKALNVGPTEREIHALITDLSNLDKQRPKPVADLSDKVSQVATNILGRLGQVHRTAAKPSAALRDSATPALDRVLGRIRDLNGAHATVSVTAQVSQAVLGNFGGGILGKNGFASGGYTGEGAKHDPAGIVHKGEWVSDAETTRRARPLLEALHRTKGRMVGYAKGGGVGLGEWKGTGADVIRAMTRAIQSTMADARRMFRDLHKVVQQNMKGPVEAAWNDRLNKAQKRVIGAYERQANLQDRLTSAVARRDALAQRRSSFAGEVRSGISSQANVLNAGNNASTIRSSLETQVTKARRFAKALQTMRRQGYSKAIIQQVAAAGIEGGLEVAKALTDASRGDRQGIVTAFAQINSAAGSTAKQLSGQMFDSGVQAANGVIAGLKRRRRAVEDTLTDIAKGMERALRRALGIRSPSTKTAYLGEMTGAGFAKGLDGTRNKIMRSASGLALGATTAMSATLDPTPGSAGRPGVRQRLTPASTGGHDVARSVHLEFKTYNPTGEPQSKTTNKALDRVASLGLL